MVYLVCYDLITQGQDYSPLINRLEDLGAIRLLYTVWLVSSSLTALDIRDELVTFMSGEDKLLVAEVTQRGAWANLLADAMAVIDRFFHAAPSR